MKQPLRETHNTLPENLHARFRIWVISRLKTQLGHAWKQEMELKMSNFFIITVPLRSKYSHWSLILHIKYKQWQWFI